MEANNVTVRLTERLARHLEDNTQPSFAEGDRKWIIKLGDGSVVVCHDSDLISMDCTGDSCKTCHP